MQLMEEYPIITICGSTKFKDQFSEAAKKLTLQGWLVFNCCVFGHQGDVEVEDESVKMMLDQMHLQKIDLSDAIYVINVDGYIGKSTQREIKYAKAHNKQIFYLEELQK